MIKKRYPEWIDRILKENKNVFISGKMYKKYIGNIKKFYNVSQQVYSPADPGTQEGWTIFICGEKEVK